MWKALTSVAPFGAWAVSEAEVASHWAAFKEKHQRVYATDAEESIRVGIFRDNLDFIAAENAKNHSYTLGITAFTDISRDEFLMLQLLNHVLSEDLAATSDPTDVLAGVGHQLGRRQHPSR